ncbi:MAG TPA: hypothetical protein VNL14_21735 [Candidatus Acidoferrales bacterium]|nr:hypothetical protein [Candidatus Acidoferrales bacterium]
MAREEQRKMRSERQSGGPRAGATTATAASGGKTGLDPSPPTLTSPDILGSPPPGRARLLVSIFIATYVLWQILLPASYYLGDYKHDERFSWRMFSYLGRLQKYCSVTVRETVFGRDPGNMPAEGFDLDLVAGSWLGLLKRGRTAVVEKFLKQRCRDNPSAVGVQLLRTCPDPSGTEIPSGMLFFNCKTGRVVKSTW